MSGIKITLMAATMSWLTGPAVAHHTYAMFDRNTTRTVSGSVARLQWMNPHAVIWIYVPSTENPGKYDLWKFENDSPNVLSRVGWNNTSLPVGTRITVQYFPLRDGSRGGHWVKGTTQDGHELVAPSAMQRVGGAQ